MSSRIVAVHLTRDGFNKPWGFRLQGGKEVNAPLSIQRVFIGSPSEGHLHRGDVITRINDQDVRYLGHAEALELLQTLGVQMKLEVLRDNSDEEPEMRSSTGGVPPSPTASKPSMWAPQSSTARSASPYRPVSPRPASPYKPVASPAPAIYQQHQSYNLAPPGGNVAQSPVLNYTVPLTSPDRQSITQQVNSGPGADHMVNSGPDADHVVNSCPGADQVIKLDPDANHVVNSDPGADHMAYRSKPLITPSPQAKHYKVMGSYLRPEQYGRPSPKIWQNRMKPPSTDNSWVKQHRVEVPVSSAPWANEQTSAKITKEVMWPPPKQPTAYRPISPVPPPKPSSPQPWAQQVQQPSFKPASPLPNAPSPHPTWSTPKSASPLPSSQQWQGPPQSSFKPVAPSFNKPAPPAVSPKPKWPPQPQPSGPTTISVPAPDPNKQVVHLQYNSPINLYSAQNVAATLTGQTGVEPKVSGSTKQEFDVTKSPTYQLLMEEEARKQQQRYQPQENEEGITQSKSFKMLQMWTGESEF